MSRAPLILDLGKGVRGIYSVAIFHVVADCISFATTFLQKSSLTHSVAPPLQTEPAALGFGLVLAANLKAAASIVLRCYTSEQSPLCSGAFLCSRTKKRHPPAPLLLLSRPQPLTLGRDLGWGADLRCVFETVCQLRLPP